MSARKQFTPEFKREAVQLVESGSRPASAIARDSASSGSMFPTRLEDAPSPSV